jgi:hypothetical protein
LSDASEKEPTIFLLHATGTFTYGVFSSIGGLIFDGSRGDAANLNMPTLFNMLNIDKYEQESKPQTIELIMGYSFLARKCPVEVKRKRKKKKRKLQM